MSGSFDFDDIDKLLGEVDEVVGDVPNDVDLRRFGYGAPLTPSASSDSHGSATPKHSSAQSTVQVDDWRGTRQSLSSQASRPSSAASRASMPKRADSPTQKPADLPHMKGALGKDVGKADPPQRPGNVSVANAAAVRVGAELLERVAKSEDGPSLRGASQGAFPVNKASLEELESAHGRSVHKMASEAPGGEPRALDSKSVSTKENSKVLEGQKRPSSTILEQKSSQSLPRNTPQNPPQNSPQALMKIESSVNLEKMTKAASMTNLNRAAETPLKIHSVPTAEKQTPSVNVHIETTQKIPEVKYESDEESDIRSSHHYSVRSHPVYTDDDGAGAFPVNRVGSSEAHDDDISVDSQYQSARNDPDEITSTHAWGDEALSFFKPSKPKKVTRSIVPKRETMKGSNKEGATTLSNSLSRTEYINSLVQRPQYPVIQHSSKPRKKKKEQISEKMEDVQKDAQYFSQIESLEEYERNAFQPLLSAQASESQRNSTRSQRNSKRPDNKNDTKHTLASDNVQAWTEDYFPLDPKGIVDMTSPVEKLDVLQAEISTLERKKSWSEAIPKAVELLALTNICDGFGSINSAEATLQLARYYFSLKHYPTALAHLNNAIKITDEFFLNPRNGGLVTKAEKDSLLSGILLVRGRCYDKLNQPPLAHEDLKLALQLHHMSSASNGSSSGGPEDENASESYCRYWAAFAALCINQGSFDKAYHFLKKVTIFPTYTNEKDNNVAPMLKRTMMEFGKDKGLVSEAIECGNLLLDIYEAHTQTQKAIKVQLMIGRLYMGKGDFAIAQKLFHDGKKGAKGTVDMSDRRSRKACEDEAKCLIQLDKYVDAAKLAHDIRQYLERETDRKSLELAGIYRMCGTIAHAQKNYVAAETNYEKALQVYQIHYSKDHIVPRKVTQKISEVRLKKDFRDMSQRDDYLYEEPVDQDNDGDDDGF